MSTAAAPRTALLALALAALIAALALPLVLHPGHKPTPTIHLSHVVNGSLSYYGHEHYDASGTLLPARFPASAPETPGAPSRVMCPGGVPQPFAVDAASWRHPTWVALSFAPSDDTWFAFTYESAGQGRGAIFTARVRGDLDCDGVHSTFERTAYIDDTGEVVARPVYAHDETE